MREALGVLGSAQVAISLRELVLVGVGGTLDVKSNGKPRDGVFATFVVALPGIAFEGGRIECREPRKDEDNETSANERVTFAWDPTTHSNKYDLSFAALYAHSVIEAAPVTRGTALFLLYDLTTTTPNEIPSFDGSLPLQRSVDTALYDYFDATSAPLAKRLKITPDAWRTINEFVSKRHFVYVVGSSTFEGLSQDERTVANSLATFCANSGAKYVLYLSAMLCSRESESYTGLGDHRQLPDDGVLQLTLKSPWLKYGETAPLTFPRVRVRQERHVAPLGRAEDVPLFVEVYNIDRDDLAIVEKLHDSYRKTGVATMFALVVLPLSVEQQQLAKVPFGEVVTRLRTLLADSRHPAIQYTRKVLQFRSPWALSSSDLEQFPGFVGTLIAINDLELFKDVVKGAILTGSNEICYFSDAVDHFGWNACVDTFVNRILTMRSLEGRVNLITAILDITSDVSRIQPLLDVLVSQHPWTNVAVADASAKCCCDGSAADTTNFALLLTIADRCSFEMPLQVASVTCGVALTECVIPAVDRLKNRLSVETLQLLVQRLTNNLNEAKTVFRNDSFARACIPPHCSNCEALQAFLEANVVETNITYTGPPSQIQHVKTVLSRQRRIMGSVTFKAAGTSTVRVTKSFETIPSHTLERAESTLNQLAGVVTDRL